MDALISTFGIDWRTLLVELVNFGIVAGGLTYFLYKPVLKMVKDREALVAKGVDDAALAATRLNEADAGVKARIAAADTEAAGIVEGARAAANDAKAAIMKDAEARAAQVAADAEARAKESAAKALRDSEQEIARLAVLAAAKAMQAK
jgi:F-type H+-transporting ATPase subunit b